MKLSTKLIKGTNAYLNWLGQIKSISDSKVRKKILLQRKKGAIANENAFILILVLA